MAATLTIIWWRDIPAQVIARSGRTTAKAVLDERFQVAIDRAAERAGKRSTDDYLAQWRRVQRDCGEDLETEAGAEARRLEADYGKDRLERLVSDGGVDGGLDATSPAPVPGSPATRGETA
jgi:hypothetical protein